MWSPHGQGMGGGRMNQLMVQVDEGGSRPCGVEGKVWLKYGEVERCWWLVERTPLQKGAPFAEGRAPVEEGAPLLLT